MDHDETHTAATDVDVLVVGAGPTGLALAAQLAGYGIRFRIVDRNLDRAHESRALAIQARTLEVLAPLGIVGEMLELGNRAVQLRVHTGRRIIPVRLFDIGTADTAYPFLLFLSQAETERILDEHVVSRGARVERHVRLTRLVESGDGVTATLEQGGGVGDGREEQVRARYVVGCDGAHSTVRREAGISFEGSAYPQSFVLADLEVDGLESGAAHVFMSAKGMLFFFPLGHPATWRTIIMRPATDTVPENAAVTLAEVQALTDVYTPQPIRLRDPVWMTNFRLHNRGAAQYRKGRVFLAGDAAHIHSPAGAQGMNTGIQDSVNLGWKLAMALTGNAPATILDTYDPERAPVGRTVRRFTDRAFRIATSTNPLIGFIRSRVAPRLMPVALRVRAARRFGFRTVSQLAIRYRGSPLAAEGSPGSSRGLRAGDRLPDVPVVLGGRGGGVSSLHALIAAPGWHLLLLGPGWTRGVAATLAGHPVLTVHRLTAAANAANAANARKAPADAARRLPSPFPPPTHRLGVRPNEPTQLLVRPDGHIGYRACGHDLAGLRGYLDRWVPASAPFPSSES